MKRLQTLTIALLTCLALSAADDDIEVTVAYQGTTATVSIPESAAGFVTCTSGTSSHVRLVQSSTNDSNPGEITYVLSGNSDDGEFYMEGEFKATVRLNGLTLTNPDSTAIHVKDGKRIKVNLPAGTTSTLRNGATDANSKGCLHCKGHTEFTGKGTLNIVSTFSHAVYSKEYVSIKNCTINITAAKKDGIHCQQYFLMMSGVVNISGVEDDGIQVELKEDTSTGVTKDHEDEDTGNCYLENGTLSISEYGSKAIKLDGTLTVKGGTQKYNAADVQENATAINTICTKANDDAAVYDLRGRQMPKGAVLPKGIYIIREGDKASKVIVR